MFATEIHTYGQLEHHKIIGYENTHDRSTLHNNNTKAHTRWAKLSWAELKRVKKSSHYLWNGSDVVKKAKPRQWQ